MVVPAMQLASKIPDMSVQLWSSALLRGEAEVGEVYTGWFCLSGTHRDSSWHLLGQ